MDTFKHEIYATTSDISEEDAINNLIKKLKTIKNIDIDFYKVLANEAFPSDSSKRYYVKVEVGFKVK